MKRVVLGLLLALAGIVSYLFLFDRWPVTRDVPWTAFLCFVLALVLMISGLRRAPRKLWPSVVTVIGVALMAFFTVGVTVLSRLPASAGAPAVGAKAPDFTLPDTKHQNVSLAQMTASGQNVLLIFYRGYW
jgi:hypothetical protein